MKRKILLVDDEVAVLLTLKAVLEISGFDVDTAASAKEAKLKLRKNQYAMVITDMRMESDAAGAEVIQTARAAEYHPALALLTAFPVAEEDWHEYETDKVEVLMKPMQTKVLLQQIEGLLNKHEAKLEALLASLKTGRAAGAASTKSNGLTPPKKISTRKTAATKSSATKAGARKTVRKVTRSSPAK